MKILAINNYPIDDEVGGSPRPRQHFWGVDFLRSKGMQVDTVVYDGYSTNRLKSLLNRVFFNLKILRKSWSYDLVLSFHSPIIDFLGIFKKVGLTKAKVCTFVHHVAKPWQVSTGFDKIYFLSQTIMAMQLKLNPMVHAMFIEWGADLDFYDYYQKEKYESSKLRLVSNGRTNRDISILIKATNELHVGLTLIQAKGITIDGELIKKGNKDVGNLINRSEMVKLMNDTDISVISVNKDFPNTQMCGLNSLIEGMALGQPVIMADNCNIALDIEKYKMGLFYRAGNVEDLKKKIKFFMDNPNSVKEYGNNARRYVEEHDYLHYCKHLYNSIINDL